MGLKWFIKWNSLDTCHFEIKKKKLGYLWLLTTLLRLMKWNKSVQKKKQKTFFFFIFNPQPLWTFFSTFTTVTFLSHNDIAYCRQTLLVYKRKAGQVCIIIFQNVLVLILYASTTIRYCKQRALAQVCVFCHAYTVRHYWKGHASGVLWTCCQKNG